MFRYNKKELIDQIKLLPGRDVPAFLKANSQTLAKLRRRDLQDVADTVICAMIPNQKFPKYTTFDDDLSYIIRTFGASAIRTRFSELVNIHVTAMMPFLERHAEEITKIYTPEKLLAFITSMTDKIFTEFKNFPLDELNRKLTYTKTVDHHDEDDRLVTLGRFDWCPDNSYNIYLPEKLCENISRCTKNKNLNIMSVDQIYELSQLYTGNWGREGNKNIIQKMKAKYDVEQLVNAVANLAKANKIIALFAAQLSALRDIRPVINILEKLEVIDKRCVACIVDPRARYDYSLALPFLRATQQVIKSPANMEAVIKFLELTLRLDFIEGHEKFMTANHPKQGQAKRNGLFALRSSDKVSQPIAVPNFIPVQITPLK